MTENSKNLKVVFFGTPDFVVPVLESLNTHFELVGMVTAPDTYEGRKKILTPSPVKAAFLNLDRDGFIATPDRLDKKTTDTLKRLQPDLFVVAAYGKLIPQDILDIPKYGSINIHPSLLPKYRGPSPIQTALLHGDKTTGVSVIVMDAELDHGPLLSQWEYDIKPEDTFESLHYELFQQAAKKLPQIIEEFVTGNLKPEEQNHNEVTFCKKITREDGFIDLENPPSPEKLDLMIRAFYPWPTVWGKITLQGKEMRIKLLPEKKFQLEGKNVTTLKDLGNGYPALKQQLEQLFH